MADKLTAELPRVRTTDQMETDLMRIAAKEDRTLSDLIRFILSEWLYGHVRRLPEPSDEE